LDLRLSRRSVACFYDEPVGFRFTEADLEGCGPRVKHNISVLEFARAELLAAQANEQPMDLIGNSNGC
jgi:hypothetical protein